MTTYEVISIISLTFTAVIAVSNFFIPLIINQHNKKIEKRDKINNAKAQEFEKIYQMHMDIIETFAVKYGEFRTNPECKDLITYIYKISPQFLSAYQKQLLNFANELKNNESTEKLDKSFSECVQIIYRYFGVEVTGSTQPALYSLMLRQVLKSKFYTTDGFNNMNFHLYFRDWDTLT